MWKLIKEKWTFNEEGKTDIHLVDIHEFDSLEDAQEVMRSDYELFSGDNHSGLLLNYSFIIVHPDDKYKLIQYGILRGE